MGKLYLQAIIEELLFKNKIFPSADSYFLKLKLPPQDSLEIGKFGEQVLISLKTNAELGNDPVFSFDYNEGYWFPVQFENKLGKTTCSSFEGGHRIAIPFRLKRCLLFQAMLGKTIKNENWLEKGERIE